MAIRLIPSSVKGKLILSTAGLLALLLSWQLVRAWWNHGVSMGTRSGVVRKIAKKGSPVCHYWMGELVISNPVLLGGVPEVWEFTVEAKNDADAIIKQLQDAESTGRRATLQFRQDKGKWWACSPLEYYVTGVAK